LVRVIGPPDRARKLKFHHYRSTISNQPRCAFA
jgi:hypothetical protein